MRPVPRQTSLLAQGPRRYPSLRVQPARGSPDRAQPRLSPFVFMPSPGVVIWPPRLRPSELAARHASCQLSRSCGQQSPWLPRAVRFLHRAKGKVRFPNVTDPTPALRDAGHPLRCVPSSQHAFCSQGSFGRVVSSRSVPMVVGLDLPASHSTPPMPAGGTPGMDGKGPTAGLARIMAAEPPVRAACCTR